MKNSLSKCISFLLSQDRFFELKSLSKEQKPNVVVITADDIGIEDRGYYHRERTGEATVVLSQLSR